MVITMRKTVFTAVCGRTNAGKSSLVNLLVGEKVAIVSEKPQTTRTQINGVLTRDGIQYVFVDTPGFHKEKSELSKHMHKSVRSAVAGVDVIILMADCTRRIVLSREMIEEKNDVILLLNKVDLLKSKAELLTIIDDVSKLREFVEIIPVSVKDGTNIDKILPILERYAKEGEYYFEPELPTDQSEKVWLSEIIREKLLHALRDELPHGIAVQIEALEHSKTNKGEDIVDLSAAVICDKQSHKGMIIGKGGATLKKIGSIARIETEEYFECKVHLKLWVKVAEDWRNRENLIHEFGLKSD
ncbi:MAG: GTPase Era [Oscillospiraceae bacterium]|nr:GTPase Era [Oscillospiraceae bacterium]